MGITPIWPEATARDAQGAIAFHGITAEQLLNDFGSPLYVLDLDEVRARARRFAAAAAHAFSTTTTHVSYAGKAFLSKEMARIVTEAGLYVDTCTMGEMRIALAAHRHDRAPSGQARAGHAARHDRHPRRWTRVHLDRA